MKNGLRQETVTARGVCQERGAGDISYQLSPPRTAQNGFHYLPQISRSVGQLFYRSSLRQRRSLLQCRFTLITALAVRRRGRE